MAACLFALYVALLPLPIATASRSKFRRSSVTYYMYAPSLDSFPPRLLVAKFSFTAFVTASRTLRALVRSKSPIVLRSNLKSNLAKFINLASNFAHRDPHLENVNSLHSNLTKNPRRFASVKQCRRLSRAVGLERAWERKGRRFVSRTPSSPKRKEKKSQLIH